ncbi:MAG: DNA mismatch repair endonuclease MutL [Clostridia bacterium]|nr:DNA mismatch repair endonuclease MutL [Clostridia bacterium]
MGIINLLDRHTINLISAGEVVERPASVIKELLENAIDAGATSVTVEIKAGGAAYMRVSDNGKGMSREDVLMCVKKHATSKIKNSDDLGGIMTLGFRGEALAAISSVSKFSIVSRRPEDMTGTLLELHGEEKITEEETGCPEGTTVTVCDLFFNLPARRKFLKKPATETGVISQYVEKIALSHPEIAFKYIADGNLKFQTAGDYELKNTIYSVYGREFASGITEVSYDCDGVSVKGYISKPEYSKTNRNFQTCFVNNRYVRAKSIIFAVEDAYKNFILSDKYPCYVIFCDVDPHTIDVNVHPAKLEIKFTDEKAIYSAVYTAVRTTLQNLQNPLVQHSEEPEEPVYKEEKPQEKTEIFTPPLAQVVMEEKKVPVHPAKKEEPQKESPISFKDFEQIFKIEEYKPSEKEKEKILSHTDGSEFKSAQPIGILRASEPLMEESKTIINTVAPEPVATNEPKKDVPVQSVEEEEIIIQEAKTEYRIIGEVFNTYILVESGDDLVFIDKHAAHERILYEQLKRTSKNDSVQMLMVPVVIDLDRKTAECVSDFTERITESGFEISSFGDNSFIVRSVPAVFSGISSSDIQDIVSEMAQNIADGKKASLPIETIYDDMLHTAACKAAIKARRQYASADMEHLVKQLYEIGNITYCPHGRPVCKVFTKKETDKLFFRT